MNSLQDQETNISQIFPVSDRVDALNQLAWRIRYSHKADALRLCTLACDLSQSGDYADDPYLAGLATGLATAGYINQLAHNLDTALSLSIQAMNILADLPPLPAASDVRSSISWINIYLGDFSTALHYALSALQIARDIHNKERQAYALDLVGNIYCISREIGRSIDHHKEALELVQEINIVEISMIIYNNYANTLFETGNYDEALYYSLKAVHLAHEKNLDMEEMFFHTSLAEILVKMEKFGQAEAHLLLLLKTYQAKQLNNPYLHMHILLGLAKLYQAMNVFEKAESNFLHALHIARDHHFKKIHMTCHQMLCELYESAVRPAQALEHFKQYHQLHIDISGVDMARKITLLKAEHQMELAKRESESYRLQNLELRHEIEERKRVETLLENLAIHDPLTNLFNRRQFSSLANSEYKQAKKNSKPLCVLLMDIDHFKKVNDHYGHLVGDRVLVASAEAMTAVIRGTDIVGRYGGEEFIAILPGSDLKQAMLISERLRKAIGEVVFRFETKSFSISISIGIAQMKPCPDQQLEDLIHQADQALYTAKRSGRNRVVNFPFVQG